MTNTKNGATGAPAWATESETMEPGTPNEWQMYSHRMPWTATMTDGGRETYPASFTLQGSSLDKEMSLRLDGEDAAFDNPEDARDFASALHRSANEWERVVREEEARAYMDVAARMGLPLELTERQISGREVVSITDAYLFARSHGVDAGEFIDAVAEAFGSAR